MLVQKFSRTANNIYDLGSCIHYGRQISILDLYISYLNRLSQLGRFPCLNLTPFVSFGHFEKLPVECDVKHGDALETRSPHQLQPRR